MNDRTDTEGLGADDDPGRTAGGARFGGGNASVPAPDGEVTALRRRVRRLGALSAASLAAVVLLGGLVLQQSDAPASEPEVTSGEREAPTPGRVERLLASLDARPVDPTEVQLVSTVSTFPDCDALVGDLRRVGAAHVGSRGFGGFSGAVHATGEADAMTSARAAADGAATSGGAEEATTLGTNVQVAGVDELDFVKAVGPLVYDLDGRGNLRITDAQALQVLSTLDVTPPAPGAPDDGQGEGDGGRGHVGEPQVSELLVAAGQVVVFGTEVEVAPPVEGDPSATRQRPPS